MALANNSSHGGGGGGSASPLTTKGDVWGFDTANDRIPVGSDGQVLTAASSQALGVGYQSPPGYEIGYDPLVSGVNIVSTTEATPTTLISCAAHTFDGAAVLLTVFFPFVKIGSAAGAQVWINLFEGSTNLGRMGTLGYPSGTLSQIFPWCLVYRFTPTAASHTYTIAGWTNNTTGTPGVGAGGAGVSGNMPGFARFTKV